MSVLRITGVRTEIVDLPLRRPHVFSGAAISRQSYLLVRIGTEPGVEGVGEGATAGGPWWGGEGVESMKTVIDTYLAPLLLDADAAAPERLRARMNQALPRNHFAKAAVEMALFDALGKHLGLSLATLLGGLCRDELPVAWALSSGEADEVLPEAVRKVAAGHTAIKLKMGAQEPRRDVARASRIARELGEEVLVYGDPNGAWDEATAVRCCAELAAAGVDMVEQPVPGRDVAAMARLAARVPLRLMADESLQGAHDAIALVKAGWVGSFALKIPKCGGLLGVRRVAAIAEAAGIACYGGTTLESSIGTAAALGLYCALPNLGEGCELIGPLLLADDLVTEPIAYQNGKARPPAGPGLGVELDEDKVRFYRR